MTNSIDQDLYYSRQSILPSVGSEGKEKLAAARVLVIGAGGLGCPVLQYLATSGLSRITVCDDDVVELTNLHRQTLYTPEDIGVHKADKAVSFIKKMVPWLEAIAITSRINPDNIDSIAGEYDIILDCTDNFETKFMVHDWCYINKKDLIQASIYQYEGQVHTFKFSDAEQYLTKPCLRCLWPETPSRNCVGSCAEVGVFGAVAGTLGTMQANEVIKLILGLPTLETGQSLIFDMLSMSMSKLSWPKDGTCPLCSKQNPTMINTLEKFDSFELKLDNISTDDFLFIDVREEGEIPELTSIPFQQWPLSEFELYMDKIEDDKNYLFFCQTGIRSRRIVTKLKQAGKTNCYSLVSGIYSFRK